MCMAMAGALISAMGLSPQFEARTRCGDLKRLGLIGGAPANKLLCYKLIGVVLCLAGADTVIRANAQQTTVTKAEAALTAKIRCEDFRKNSDGPGPVARARKLAPTIFPTTPLTLLGSALERRT